jgi:puromycin-sensitive aminopeptidase
MLEQHIGSEVFRDGVRTYLKTHAYGNTVTSDLWDALEDASGAPVRDVMDTFILQGGHPLVTLEAATLRQEPFAFGPVPAGTVSAIGTSWNVPISVRALPADGRPGASTRHLVLGSEPITVGQAEQGLAVVNAGGWGVFRVGYESAHRIALADRLSELTPLERANLVADTWATTLSGRSTLEEFLLLGARLGLEPDPTPWAPLASALTLCNRLTGEADRPALEAAVSALIGPQFTRLGFEAVADEGERTPTLRSLAIQQLGVVGADADVRAEAASRFDASPAGGGSGPPIPADVESATLAVVAQLRRPGDFEALLERYRSAPNPQVELRSLHALAAFPDIELAERTFDLALSEVRSQNGWGVIMGLLSNPTTGQAIWRRMTANWDRMMGRFPKNAPARLIEPISALCADARFAEGAVEFLAAHPLASGQRRVQQSIERLGVNLAFAAREREHLGDAFRAAAAAPAH